MELKCLKKADTFFLKPTNITQTTTITCMATDGYRVFLGSLNGMIRGWNIKNNKLEGTFADHKSLINGMTLLNDGTMISVSDDCSMLQWSTRSYDKIRKFVGPEKPITCCAALYSKEVAATLNIQQKDLVLLGGSWDCRIYLWSPVYVDPCRVLVRHPAPVKKIAVFENKTGHFVASGCDNGEILVWNLKTLSTVFRVQAHSETISDLKIYNGHILSSSRDRRLKVWDSKLGLVRELDTSIDHVNKFVQFRENFLITVRGVKKAEIWGATTKKIIDGYEKSTVVSEVAVVDNTTIALARSHEVKLFKYVNMKTLALRMLHKFREEAGYPPVIVKSVCEAILSPDLL